MKRLPNTELIEEISIELGVDPSFVEKDWFATQVLTQIASIESPQIIFTGGTSLSKAYGLIQRFSEDLDFRICTSANCFTRGERKAIRSQILSKIANIDEVRILNDSILSRNESKFFSFNIEYPQHYNPSQSLRPHLKLEFSFEKTLLSPELKEVRSFISQFTEDIDCQINTISPIETAANKYSALLWRINIKDRKADRGTPQNDPTMIRHLHDLASLIPTIQDSVQFTNIVNDSFVKDCGRGGSDKEKSVVELSKEAIDQLKTDTVYAKEYQQFVDAMSYAPDNERINFTRAVDLFETLTTLFH